jgi:tetratricopeptide (TPR) repeat protein
MSTINEALKKAQKNKDTRNLLYSSVLSIASRKNPLLKKKNLAWLIISILIVIGTLASDAWLNKNNFTPSVRIETEDGQAMLNKSPRPVSRENLDRFYDRARNFHGEGRLQLAKRFYQEVLAIDPGHSDAINNLGVIALAEKDFEQAEKYFNKALKINSGSVDSYYNLACLYALKGDIRQSIDYLKKAILLNENALEWAKKDTDLNNLRETLEYRELFNR